MFNDLKNDIYSFINKNSFKLFFLLLCVAAGLVCGALFSAGVPEDKSNTLTEYIVSFGTAAHSGELTYISVLKTQVLKSLRTFSLLLISSLSVFFVPVILVNSFGIGFTTGFTLGFMSLSRGFGGFVMASVSVLPEFIIILPMVLLLSVLCLNRALQKQSLHNNRDDNSEQKLFAKKVIMVLAFILVGNIINSLVVAEFSKFAGGLIIL